MSNSNNDGNYVENAIAWVNTGCMQSNIFVQYEIRSIIQDKYEGDSSSYIDATIGTFKSIFTPSISISYSHDSGRLTNDISQGATTNYDKWVKDW